MVTLFATAVPDVVLFLEQINISLGTWCVAPDRANVFSSILVHRAHQKRIAFSRQGEQCIFPVLPWGNLSSPDPHYDAVGRDLDHLSLPQDITLVSDMEDIMWIGPRKQEAATTLDLLVRHWCVTMWEVNLMEIWCLLPQ